MDIISEGCRLCLDPLTQCFTTIDSPQMTDQMEKVFCFTIKPKPGYSSDVCQSCSHIISEFYMYSEKVRQNQEFLNENVTNCDPTVDSKIMLGRIKIEPLNNSDLPEVTEGAWDPENEVSGEEGVSNFGDNEMYEPPANQLQGHVGKLDDLEADEPGSHDQEVLKGNEIMIDPAVDSQTTLETVKVETHSDSGRPETTEDTGEPIFEASAEEEVSNLNAEVTFESVKVEATSDDSILSEIEISDEEEAPNSSESCEPPPEKSQTKQVHPKQTRREAYEEDLRVFNKHFRMICDLCGTSAETFTDLSSHFRMVHKRNGYVVCCNKKLIKRNALRQHIKLHANPDLFRCEVCGCKYKSRSSLNEHMAIKHPSPGAFKCDLCPQSFAKELALTFHMKKRHVENKCPKCGNIFATRETLSRHLAKMHDSDTNQPMVCDICGNKFQDLYALSQHRKEHIAAERIQCRICQRWLKGYSSIRYHMNCAHGDSTLEHQCDICFQKFPDPKAVYNHKLFMHSELKHECEFCGKKFRLIAALKEHRATHTAELGIGDHRKS